MMILGSRLKWIFTASAWAVVFTPLLSTAGMPCLDSNGSPVKASNAEVIRWKSSTPNQFVSRALVTGRIENLYPFRNRHHHFQIRIGPKPEDTLEIVYNVSFGALPALVPGTPVEACGDYITSIAPTQTYEPSPDGALLHWIHRSPNPRRHASGYLILNGTLYGQGSAAANGFEAEGHLIQQSVHAPF